MPVFYPLGSSNYTEMVTFWNEIGFFSLYIIPSIIKTEQTFGTGMYHLLFWGHCLFCVLCLFCGPCLFCSPFLLCGSCLFCVNCFVVFVCSCLFYGSSFYVVMLCILIRAGYFILTPTYYSSTSILKSIDVSYWSFMGISRSI